MASVELTNRRFTLRFILSALFVSLLCQSILNAQVPSRAELLEAERETKVEEVRAPERTTIERGMRASKVKSERSARGGVCDHQH